MYTAAKQLYHVSLKRKVLMEKKVESVQSQEIMRDLENKNLKCLNFNIAHTV